jgi:DUF1680 family protein
LCLRIQVWAENISIRINGRPCNAPSVPGYCAEISNRWKTGDAIMLMFPMKVETMEINLLVEEIRNRVVLKRGPVVYCLESVSIPPGYEMDDISILAVIQLSPMAEMISASTMVTLTGEAFLREDKNGEG